MPNTNAGPAVSSFVNEVPLRGTFDINGKLIQILGSGQNVAFDPANVAITGGVIAGSSITPGTQNSVVQILGSEVGGALIYGPASTIVTVGTLVIPAGRITPNAILRVKGLVNFPTANAGRVVFIALNGTNIGQSFPTTTSNSLQFEHIVYVLPDLSGVIISSQNLNNILSPSPGVGMTYAAQSFGASTLSLDLTGVNTFTVQIAPQNNDMAQLSAWSVEQLTSYIVPTSTLAPVTSLACWGDSLTAGTGSLSASISTISGTTTQGSATITVTSTAGVATGQIITGAGIPSNSTVASFVANASITFTNDLAATATASASGIALIITAGPWTQLLMYAMPGRPVLNAGIGGQTSTQILARQQADKVRGRYWIQVFWMCRNDTPTFISTLANIKTAIASLPVGARYIVLNATPANGETNATGNGQGIATFNASLVAAIPSMNFVDIFSVLTSGTANGTIQASWMIDATVGNPHLNELGYYQVSKAIQAKLTVNNW